MSDCTPNRIKILFAILAFLACSPVMASHLVGDEFTYQLIDSSSGTYHYRVTLNLYEDCLDASPGAIAADNPAYFCVYKPGSPTPVRYDSVFYSTSISIPGVCLSSCGSGSVSICLIKKTFMQDYYFPNSTTGYIVAYQRCCRNSVLSDLLNPGNTAVTYMVSIPPTSTVSWNNSAVFNHYPPEILCDNIPFFIDNSASDTDGDSLSYELCSALNGNTTMTDNFAVPPPYDSVTYLSSFSGSNPMACSIPMQIDPVTGLLTGTPDRVGRYLVTICCHEWRRGIMINTVSREFEFAVTDCSTLTYQPNAGNDTNIMVGDTIFFHASGAASYSWDPSTYLSDTSLPNPMGIFPVAGTFRYVLHGISDSGCSGYDTIVIGVFTRSGFEAPTAFTPNNDGLNDFLVPIPVMNSVLVSFKVYNRNKVLLFSTSIPNDGWDGTYKGVKQDPDTYYWEVFYRDNAGTLRNITGSSLLIR